MRTEHLEESSWFASAAALLAEPAAEPAAEKARCAARKPVVLVPVDFTAGSMEAVRAGLKIARESRGLLLLLHAVPLNLSPYGPADPERLKAALCREALGKAESALVEAHESGVTATCAVEEGVPAEVIQRAARRWKAEIIVLAAQKRRALARWFRRRTVERIVREAPCPVYVLQANGQAKPACTAAY